MSNLEKIKGVYDAFAKRDIPSVLATLSPEIEWTEAEGFPYGGTYRGPIRMASSDGAHSSRFDM